MTLEGQNYEIDLRSLNPEVELENCNPESEDFYSKMLEVAEYYRQLCQLVFDKSHGDFDSEQFVKFVDDMPAVLRREYDKSFEDEVIFVMDPHYLTLESVYMVHEQYEFIHGEGSYLQLKTDMLATPENLQTVLCFSSVIKEARANDAFAVSFDW